jgi:hypothetical protein
VTFFQGQGGIRVVRNSGSAATVARLVQQLDVQWDRLGTGREFAERHMALLERLTQRVLTSLYKELIEPLEPLLKETVYRTSDRTVTSRKLVIVPHGLLHRVPLEIRWFAGVLWAAKTSRKRSHCFTRQRSLVRTQHRPPRNACKSWESLNPRFSSGGCLLQSYCNAVVGLDVVQRYLEVGPIGELGVEEYAARLGHGLRGAWLWYGW